MKPKNILWGIVALAMTCFGLWWFTRPKPTPPASATVTASPVAAKFDQPKQVAPSSVASPVAPPTLNSAISPAPTAPAAEIDQSATEVELDAVIADLIDMEQAPHFTGINKYDLPEILQRVSQRSPQQKAQDEQYWSSPAGQQMIQYWTQMYRSLVGQSPEMNADGNEATYSMTPPPGIHNLNPAKQTIDITFVKIDGRWYISRSEGFRVIASP